MKIALAIEYHGAAFCGWQSQRGGQAVQDAVQHALTQVAEHAVTVHAAGRTDAGVHATLMPAHFETPLQRQPSAWQRGANAHLPPAVKVLWAKPVTAAFHARHHAERRYYQYLLLNRDTPPALFMHSAGHCHVALDLQAMRAAAAHLLGEHDFSAFRAAACQAKTPVRHLHSLHIAKHGDWVVFNFCGNGFLHHMVRNIVGTLLYVGRGRQPPGWTAELLRAKDRTQAAPTATAAGLYFNGAQYNACYKLPPCVQTVAIGSAPSAPSTYSAGGS